MSRFVSLRSLNDRSPRSFGEAAVAMLRVVSLDDRSLSERGTSETKRPEPTRNL
jgi:hypothetical protein